MNAYRLTLVIPLVLAATAAAAQPLAKTAATDITLAFSQVVNTADDPRQLAAAIHSITFIDAGAHAISEITLGTTEANSLQGEGWFENETSAEVGAFQWAGTEAKQATIQIDIPDQAEGMLLKLTSAVEDLWVDVSINGELATRLHVDMQWHSGYVPIGEPTYEVAGIVGPEWIDGRNFPHFPAAERVYAIPVQSILESPNVSQRETWRINQSSPDMLGLTLVGMQGIINRTGATVYLNWINRAANHPFWKERLKSHVDIVDLDLDALSAVHFLMRRYADRFTGAVIYDPEIPETINLATMIAGLEDRVILAPEQIGLPGIPDFESVTDLRDLAVQEGWDASVESQTDIYQWVYDNLWPDLDHRILGMISPGPPTSREQSPGFFWALGMASRDYHVALRLPVLYLHPVEEPQKSLLSKFMEEAESPIPITGGVSNLEHDITGLGSEFGHWQAAISWPGRILTVGNLTVFSSVRPDIKRYEPTIDPGRILATLSDGPIVSMWSSDGDAVFYQMRRGFDYYRWDRVQNQRFGWTMNPTLIDLAPTVWNYYMETASEVGFVAGLSGAGYAYPQLMDEGRLDAYLDNTAGYLSATGLRSVRVDSRGSQYSDDFLGKYAARLLGTDYLGLIFGWSGPNRGINLEYWGGPASVVRPSYTLTLSRADDIAADILGRIPGEERIDIAAMKAYDQAGTAMPDADASRGEAAVFVPASVTDASGYLAVSSPILNLAPGSYTLTFRLKVANNQSSENVANIFLGQYGIGGDGTIVSSTLTATDFSGPNTYQDFALSFDLDSLAKGIEFRIDYLGTTDLYADYILAKRMDGLSLPVVAPVFIGMITDEPQGLRLAPGRLIDRIEAGGGVVLSPDELLAALNPDYMIDFATPILGSSDPGLAEAMQYFEDGRYIESLLRVRDALRPQIARKIAVAPSELVLDVGQTDTIDILIEGIADLGGFDIEVLFDPGIVRVDTVLPGPFSGSGGRVVTVSGRVIDNGAGRVTFGAATSGPGSGASGSGVLARLVVTSRKEGATKLVLENAVVSDVAGQNLTIGALIPGMVSVSSTTESWSTQASGTLNRLYSVSAVSNEVAWASGTNGTVLLTTDGGESWTNVWNGAPRMHVYTIEAIDDQTAHVFGIEAGRAEAVFFRTTDGGGAWDQVYEQTDGVFSGIRMFDANHGVAVGSPENGLWTILETRDGGGHWDPIFNPPTAYQAETGFLNGAIWVDEQTGWFGSNGGRAMFTKNGGSGWDAVDIAPLDNVVSIAFDGDTGLGLAVSSDAMAVTSDGATWSPADLPQEGTVRQITAQNGRFWLLIDGSLYSSSDNGLTWALEQSAISNFRHFDTSTDQSGSVGWAVGDDGLILKYRSEFAPVGIEHESPVPTSFVLDQNYPNPFSATTTIQFSLPEPRSVRTHVYSLLGSKVATVVDEVLSSGVHRVQFDARSLASGMYLLTIEAGEFWAVRKMVVVR